MKLSYLIAVLFFLISLDAPCQVEKVREDSTRVKELNQLGYSIRLTNPEQALKYGKEALALANKISFPKGAAEAHRIVGIGFYYLGQKEVSLTHYLTSLSYYSKTNDISGQAKVLNNIGNLYREVDYDKALMYFQRSLLLAEKQNIRELLAGSYLNIGIIYFRKKQYSLALSNFKKSYSIFKELKNSIGITQSLQNQGVIYFNLKQIEKAEKLLLEANKKAKESELNNSIASIDLTLTSIYTASNQFKKAEEALNEGKAYAEIVKSDKLEHDYLYTSYELEYKRRNYRQALAYLQQVYKQDSINNNTNESLKVALLQEQYRQREKERKNELIIERQKNDRILFWASTVVAVMFLFVIGLLYVSNRRKIRTNKQLTILNSEISQQKEELDWINHRLEEIIDERTKDLQIKNKKLSDYSWHLSHQIRGPIATMKGLMLLEKDNLIDEKEFISEMEKCLNEIDLKIMNINEALHNPKQIGFSSSRKD